MDKLSADVLRAHKGVSFVGVTTGFICYSEDKDFVMAKRGQNARDEQGNWDFGAGGLKWGVGAEDNVRREVKEEYGANAHKIDFIGYMDLLRELPDGTKTHWLLVEFAVLVNKAEVTNNEPEILDEIGWFTLDALPSPLHSQIPRFLDRFRDNIAEFIH